MCGISGFNWSDNTKAAGMVDALAHRGPDARGVFTAEGISLGHNRLAVIDLSPAANQPMHDPQGELTVVFNGEIYNFKELKKELEAEYEFKTGSDTEVLLAGYRAWGKDVAARLNGMFAFAIWDKRTKTLFCARDHAGMKPFYYYWDGDRFIFASEPQALLTHDIPRTLNREAFNHYMRVLYTPEPLTLIQNVFKLPPAHTLTLCGTSLRVTPFAPPAIKAPASYAAATAAVKQTVVQAVERHLVADVPVGVYLSGGIDSSIMLAAATKAGGKMKAFTIGFELGEGEEAGKFNADLELAKQTAAHFGAEHHVVHIGVADALAALTDATAHNSDPISNPTSLAMLLLAREAKKQVTVVLTGNGGDELFGGYDRYRYALAAHYYHKLPRMLRALLNKHPRLRKLDQSPTQLFAQFMFQKDSRVQQVVAPAFYQGSNELLPLYAKYFGGADAADTLMRADETSWLPDHFFMLSDKMSMASALEERMPLLDTRVQALAHALPRRYKTGLFATKRVLKDAFRGDLPDFLFTQPKRGWFSPAAKWLRHKGFADAVRATFAAGYHPPTAELFNWPAVQHILDDHISKKQYNLTLVWAIFTFQLWAKQHDITL